MAFTINGLSSGLDTAQIISDMMDIERIPYKNLEAKKSNLQTEQAVFRQVNTKLSTLQRLVSDLQYSATFQQNTGTFSNSGVGSATVASNAATGSYALNVTNLAQKQITGVSGITGTGTELVGSTFSINGEDIVLDSTLGTFTNNKGALEALVKKINSDTATYSGKASLVDTTGNGSYALSITANETGSSKNVSFSISGSNLSTPSQETTADLSTLEAGKVSLAQLQTSGAVLKVNGKDLNLEDVNGLSTATNLEDALFAIRDHLNKPENSSFGVTASMNFGVLSLKDTVTNEPVTTSLVRPVTLNSLSSLELQAGQDAVFTLDGVSVTRSTNEVSDLITGVTLSLQGTGSSTLTIGKDVEKITSQVEEFVTAYNDLIKLVKTNLSKPADEGTMNPLQGDSTLKALQNDLYNLFNRGSEVGTNNNGKPILGFMEQFGLSIDKGVKSASLMTGEIAFNKTEFQKALKENPDIVSTVFTDTAEAMRTKMLDYTNSSRGILSMKVTGYDSEIKVVDERLEAMDKRLILQETRLKQQFGNMEVMLSSLQAEQDWLSSQFESLLNTKKS